MRRTEGRWFVNENKEIIYAQTMGTLKRDEPDRYMDGDILYGEILCDCNAYDAFARDIKTVDGHMLSPLIYCYELKDEQMCKSLRRRIIFDE